MAEGKVGKELSDEVVKAFRPEVVRQVEDSKCLVMRQEGGQVDGEALGRWLFESAGRIDVIKAPERVDLGPVVIRDVDLSDIVDDDDFVAKAQARIIALIAEAFSAPPE